MKPYKKYKNVGEDWIGLIPSNWEFSKLKFLAKTKISTIDRHEYDTEINVRVCHYPQAYKNEKINSTTELSTGTCTEKELDNFSLKKGQVVITKDSETADDIGVPTFIEEDIQNAVCGYHLAMLETCQDLNSDFLFRYLQSKNVRRFFEANVNGVTRFGLSKSTIENLFVPLPSVNDQVRIAHFLNYQTTIIDKLISKKEKLIDKLKEKRQAIINEAVTKGLDPNAKTKDSGIEWLGKVPDKWILTAIKNVLEIPITDGPHTTPTFIDSGVPFVSAESVKDGKIDFEKKRGYISEEEYELYSKKYVPKVLDIFMVKSGATTGNVAILRTEIKFTIWSPLAVFRANSNIILPDFLFLYLQSDTLRKGVEVSWSYGTQQNIGMGVLSNLKVIFPELAEQQRIVDYTISCILRIENLSRKIEHAIIKIKEYRQSLISEVVTGKIDVRGWELPAKS